MRGTSGIAHHSKVVLGTHDAPVFSARAKAEGSENVLLAHGSKLQIYRSPIFQHCVAGSRTSWVNPLLL